MSWFSKKDSQSYPDFWNAYQEAFAQTMPTNIESTRFVVIDTETTGLDCDLDRIISIGGVVLKNNSIQISESIEWFLKQDRFNAKTVSIHGQMRNEHINLLTEEQALRKFLAFIGSSILVAHHAQFDVKMINIALGRMGLPPLKNRVLDTVNIYRASRIKSNLIDRNKNYSLDEIAENYDLDVKDRHTAAGDALITAFIFVRALGTLSKSRSYSVSELLKL